MIPPPEVDLVTYCALYAEAKTHLAKAEVEIALVADLTKYMPDGSGLKANIAAELLGVAHSELHNRRYLWINFGFDHEVWGVLEAKKVPAKTARIIIAAYGYDAFVTYDREEALRGRGRRHTSNGGVSMSRARQVGVAAQAKEIPWALLRKDYLSKIGKHLPTHLREGLLKRFDRDLTALNWDGDVRTARREAGTGPMPELPAAKANRAAIVSACRTLHIDPPKPNAPVDPTAARRARKQLSREYHPDVTGGDVGLIKKFQEVNEAYRLIDDYNQSISEIGEST